MAGPAPGPTNSAPLALDRPDDVRRVRDALDRAGYDESRTCWIGWEPESRPISTSGRSTGPGCCVAPATATRSRP